MSHLGDPIRGELHSADAHLGVEIPIFTSGSLTTRTLAADEYIEVHSIELVTAPGGDCSVFIGDDATPGAGEYVIRGTLAVAGGIVLSRTLFAGRPGHKPYVVAPAGVVDVIFTGSIRRGVSSLRPTWRESLVPGQ